MSEPIPEEKKIHVNISAQVYKKVLEIKPERAAKGAFLDDIIVWGIDAYRKYKKENPMPL